MIKLAKSLVTIVSSLWTRYSIKKLYANVRIDVTPPPPPIYSQTFVFWWGPHLPPTCERSNWMPPYWECPKLLNYLSSSSEITVCFDIYAFSNANEPVTSLVTVVLNKKQYIKLKKSCPLTKASYLNISWCGIHCQLYED